MSKEKPRNPAKEPKESLYHGLRGGYAGSTSPHYSKSASRYHGYPSIRSYKYGFRIARTKK